MSLSLPAGVRPAAGRGSLESITVSHPAAHGEIYLQGATVTSWQPAGHAPVLWVSPSAAYRADSAIRGGIPICFPWFGPNTNVPGAPQHGFVRAAPWSLEDAREAGHGEAVAVTLSKRDDEHTRALWPHAFLARLTVSFGATLDVAFSVHNAGALPFSFEVALHAYFAVSDVRTIAVTGLEEAEYIDKVDRHALARGGREPLVLEGEVDRVYIGNTATVEIVDPGWHRRVSIQKDGSRTTVVWNPGQAKAATMKDVGDAWAAFVCVETTNAAQDAVTLAPGAEHITRARVAVSHLQA